MKVRCTRNLQARWWWSESRKGRGPPSSGGKSTGPERNEQDVFKICFILPIFTCDMKDFLGNRNFLPCSGPCLHFLPVFPPALPCARSIHRVAPVFKRVDLPLHQIFEHHVDGLLCQRV